jgi:hypothetical protein
MEIQLEKCEMLLRRFVPIANLREFLASSSKSLYAAASLFQ